MSTKPNYKNTLNLPKTDFAMKANLSQNEAISQKRWDELGLYAQITKARHETGGAPFVFHDGPPYANGSIHTGHLLNKVLKDLVVRSRLMMGHQCPYIPGWDCHGLPIEHKVMTEMFASREKADKLQSQPESQRRLIIRRECAKYAEKYVKLQAGQMKRLSTLADYDDPYVTMEARYEKAVLNAFAELVGQGLVYRALKPVHWSIANQTALAEAELEYEDREDPSIYVDFEAVDMEAVGQAFGVELDQTPSFMIWTTTPWTLPANLAIAVHERYRYSLVRVDGNLSIIASDLVGKVTGAAKAEQVQLLAETDGKNLVGLRYRHPFISVRADGADVWRIVAAEYVTLEDGTGLVHTAPGHGTEDYQTALREKLHIYCPVRGDGTYDDTAPDWLRGVSVWDANERVLNHLRESGHLFHSHQFSHSYPHDWRSKTPVIFRATEQWFIGVDQPTKSSRRSLREMAIKAAEREVTFYPEWGRNRLRGMLESRPDWCISRQRAWGLPIPAFHGPKPGQVLLTKASVVAVAKLIGENGSDVWFQSEADALLQHYDVASDPDAPEWLHQSGFRLTDLATSNDILDVWFESGTSWNAVLCARQQQYPADLYLEGSDQHRGWFQSSLLPALGVTGQPPFKSLLTHGFIVDKDGRKMSKSLGNTLEVEDLLKSFGADVCRWWVCSLAFENDIKMDISFLETAGESYRKVRNTIRFLLSNLFDFNPAQDRVSTSAIGGTTIDGYVLQEAEALRVDVVNAFRCYEFRQAYLRLYDFCNDTLSAFYCAAVKDRLYCDRADAPRRRATQTVMWDLVELLSRLLAPIMPHTADEAYRSLWRDERSVHLRTIDDFDLAFSADDGWPFLLQMRRGALLAIESARQAKGIDNPLDCGLAIHARTEDFEILRRFSHIDIADMLGISQARLNDAGTNFGTQIGFEVVDLRDTPRCDRSWKRDGTVRQRADGGLLTDRDAEAVGMG